MYQKCDAFAEVLFNNIKHIISLMLTVMSAIFVAKTSFNTVEKGVSMMLLIFLKFLLSLPLNMSNVNLFVFIRART